MNDIQYKEGILEYLEQDKNIDYIILDEKIPGNISLENLIFEIKKMNNKIKLILITEKINEKIKINNKINYFEEKTIKNIINKKINNYYYKINNLNENKKIENIKLNNLIKNNEIDLIKNNEIKKLNSTENKKIKNNKIKNNKFDLIKNNEIKKLNLTENKKIKNNNFNFYKNNQLNKINLENNYLNNKNKIFSEKFISKNDIVIENHRGKVISILGTNGIGKSVFSTLIAREIKDKQIAIIDFDILNNSLNVLLGIEDYKEKIKQKIKIINQNIYKEENNKIFEKVKPNKNTDFKIDNFTIKIKNNIDLIYGLNLIYEINEKIIPDKIRKIFKELKKKYDIIIIDTSSECFFDYTREMIRISDEVIFISGANLLETRKTEKLLQIYNQEWKIEKSKIKIIFNKCTKNSLDSKKLYNIFGEYKIIGKIKLNDFYDYLINNKKENIEQLKNEINLIREIIEKEKGEINKVKNFNSNI